MRLSPDCCHIQFLQILLLACSLSAVPSRASPAIEVRYPKPQASSDKRQDYPIQLLRQALEASDQHYQLKSSEVRMPQSRALLSLKQGKGIDVVWTMTSKDREAELLPIRIPIYRGVIGWRLLLIRQDEQQKIAALSPQALKQLNAVQGHDWPDTQILKANGFLVEGGSHYQGLFQMLLKKRVDFFPRSIAEIWREFETHKHQGIMIDNQWLLHYRTAAYFFVSPNNRKLARDLHLGLQHLIDNGEFQRLFERYYSDQISRAQIPARRVIYLDNPLLPTATPLFKEEFWQKIPR